MAEPAVDEIKWKLGVDNSVTNIKERMNNMEETGKEIVRKIDCFERKFYYFSGMITVICAIPAAIFFVIKLVEALGKLP